MEDELSSAKHYAEMAERDAKASLQSMRIQVTAMQEEVSSAKRNAAIVTRDAEMAQREAKVALVAEPSSHIHLDVYHMRAFVRAS